MPVDLPTKPTIQTLIPPQYFDLTLPVMDKLTWPTLDLTILNQVQPIPGSPAATYLYTKYASTIRDAINQKVLNYFDFSYARWVLFAEFAIGRRPLAEKFHQVQTAEFDAEAKRGLITPTGEFRRNFETLELSYREALQNTILEIDKNAFELYKGIREFSLKATNQIESIAIDEHNHIQAATLKYALIVADIAIANYKAWFAHLQVRTDAISTYVDGWKTSVTAQLALMDEFEAQTEFALGTIEKDSALIQLYTAHIEYLKATSSVQELEYDSAIAEIMVEKAQLDQYLAEINKYTANIQLNTAEFQKYAANVDLALVDFDKWKAAISIAEAQIDAAKARTAASASIADSNLQVKRIRLGQLNTVLDHARKRLQLLMSLAQKEEDKYKVKLLKYEQALSKFLEDEKRKYMEYENETKLEHTQYKNSEDNINKRFMDKTSIDASKDATLRISSYNYDRTVTQAEVAAFADISTDLIINVAQGS